MENHDGSEFPATHRYQHPIEWSDSIGAGNLTGRSKTALWPELAVIHKDCGYAVSWLLKAWKCNANQRVSLFLVVDNRPPEQLRTGPPVIDAT
ncbi:hypothetical protein KA005_71550 [bacterium]|nr:hypothetical protein [bacterium]